MTFRLYTLLVTPDEVLCSLLRCVRLRLAVAEESWPSVDELSMLDVGWGAWVVEKREAV